MLVAAFDPGKNVGYALVATDGSLLESRIIALADLHEFAIPHGALILVGDGTGSYAVRAILARRNLETQTVDERGTSIEARSYYFRDNPPPIPWRWLPRSLWWPPRSIDDYAAYAIALRYLGRDAGQEFADEAGQNAGSPNDKAGQIARPHRRSDESR